MAAIVVPAISCLASEPGEMAIKELRRSCSGDISSEKAAKLREDLKRRGTATFDALVGYATGKESPPCRAVAVFALFDLADKDPNSIARFILGLRRLSSDRDLRETLEITCGNFGTLANDSLISLLESDEPQERKMALDCLVGNNAESLKDRPDLKSYDPQASPEERKRFTTSWRDWWRSKNG